MGCAEISRQINWSSKKKTSGNDLYTLNVLKGTKEKSPSLLLKLLHVKSKITFVIMYREIKPILSD